MTVKALLKTEQMTKRFGGLTAVDKLDLDIEEHRIHSVIGPNGAGKTTVFNCIMNFYPPDAGRVWFNGARVDGVTPDRVASAGINRTYQNIRLFRNLTALENILVPMELAGLRDADDRARQLLKDVDLVARAHHYPSQLSGGERQRVAIARAFGNEPSIMLADEPTGNLDSATSEEILGLFEALHREGQTIVLVTHEADIAEHALRQVHLKDGRVERDFVTKGKSV